MKCGSTPKNLGYINVDHSEMMFWQYCPIGRPGDTLGQVLWQTPENLLAFHPLIAAAFVGENNNPTKRYVYLTAKTVWVSPPNIGNRPGWHIDGIGTTDVNYIWYDRAPTEFIEGRFDISDDCATSMEDMERNGPYPYHLQERVAGPRGHLSNYDCARFAAELVRNGAEQLILSHLSDKNNTPAMARMETEAALMAEKLHCTMWIAPKDEMAEPIWLQGKEEAVCCPSA